MGHPVVSHSWLSISLDLSINSYPIQIVTKPFMARIILSAANVEGEMNKKNFSKENSALVF